MEAAEYGRIAEKYIDAVFRAALSCCRNRSDAEDATQNTFMKLLTADVRFADEEHIRRWLIRVAVNECKNDLRSFRRRSIGSLDELGPEPAVLPLEQYELLYEIGRLPAKYSAVLHLYYYEGYSCAEIAGILHISETNVQTRLSRARNILKKNLKEA